MAKKKKKLVLLLIASLVSGILLVSVDDSCEQGRDWVTETDSSGSGQKADGGAQGGGTAPAGTAAGTTAAGGTSGKGGTASSTGTSAAGGASGTTGTAAAGTTAAGGTSGKGGTASSTGTSAAGGASGTTGTAAAGTTATGGTSGKGGTAASTGTSATGGAVLNGSIAGISGKNWKLVELRTSTKTYQIDRKKLDSDGMGDLFTFSISGERISGKAAPNRYTANFKTGGGDALSISPPASTMMASIYDPERIKEREYFEYLTKVNRWKLNQGRLELYTTDGTGKEAVLIYVN